MGLEFWPNYQSWFTTDALGLAIATPAFVAVFKTKLRDSAGGWTNFLYPIGLLVIVPILFHQSRFPMMAVIYPLLVLIELRSGLGWAALATLLVAIANGVLAVRSGSLEGSSPLGREESDC